VNLAKVLIDYYEKSPSRPVIHFQTTGQPDETITYRDLIHGAMGYVKVFKENKVEPGDVVLLILQHGLDMAYAYLLPFFMAQSRRSCHSLHKLIERGIVQI
jgi:acyl-coenzyme A synthetase/AMP-(fatty) acid ligase